MGKSEIVTGHVVIGCAGFSGSHLTDRLPADGHTEVGIDSFLPKTEMRLTNVLVTGGAGFIGSHVTAELLRRGHTVRVIDNFSTGSRENLAAVGGDVELVEGDIRSHERTHAATKGVECMIHLAALPSVPRSVQDPLTTNEVNVTGTLNVVLAARDAGTQRVVMASSSSVYGRAQELPKTEGLVPQPILPYGVSKLAAEQY